MKQYFRKFVELFILVAVIVLAVLLIMKICSDASAKKQSDEELLNTQNEYEYFCKKSTEFIKNLKSKIEESIGTKVELAETGSLKDIDIYFVVKQDEQYKYVVEQYVDNTQKFKIVEDESKEAKYILSVDVLGFKDCLYTNIANYNVDKDGNVEYIDN